MLKSDSTVDGSKVQKKDRLLAITFNGTDAVILAITFSGTDACKVPELLFQPIYREEHISGCDDVLERQALSPTTAQITLFLKIGRAHV